MKKLFPYIFVAIVTLLMLFEPEASIASAKASLILCADVIVPSLFPFFVCSGLLVHSGLCRSLAHFLEPVMKPVFNVSGCGAIAFVLGILSGYPQGAITTCNLYQSGYISKSEAERLLAFCNNAGPLFVLSAVGVATYSSPKIGVILYISHIISSVLVGVLFRFYKKQSHNAPKYSINQSDLPFSEAFSNVLRDSVSNILTVCGAIVFFGTFGGLIGQFLPENPLLKGLFSGVLELSRGNSVISSLQLPLVPKLVLSAFSVGFAGCCVHLQVAAITSRHHLSLAPYLLGKLLHGVFSAAITLGYLHIFRITPAFATSVNNVGAGIFLGSFFSISALAFLVCLGIFIQKNREISSF